MSAHSQQTEGNLKESSLAPEKGTEAPSMGRTVSPDGKRIKELRESKGWRVSDLANKAICSVKTVQSVEKGRPVYKVTLHKIADALKVEYDSLLIKPWFSWPKPKPPSDDPVLIALIFNIPFHEFDESDELIKLLKGIISTKKGLIEVSKILPGSTRVDLLVTEKEAIAIITLWLQKKLSHLPIETVGWQADIPPNLYKEIAKVCERLKIRNPLPNPNAPKPETASN